MSFRPSSKSERFGAPWSLSLIIMSLSVTVFFVAISACHWSDLAAMRTGTLDFWIGLLPLIFVFGSAFFTIRGYSLTPEAILIHRLLWDTRLPRATLQSARVEPDALRGAIRTCGNGGAFSFSGWCRSPALGSFRAFITDPARAVVLCYPHRTAVISPADPERFVHELSPNSTST